MGSIYVRDALLDPDPSTARDYRNQLEESARAADLALQECVPVLGISDAISASPEHAAPGAEHRQPAKALKGSARVGPLPMNGLVAQGRHRGYPQNGRSAHPVQTVFRRRNDWIWRGC